MGSNESKMTTVAVVAALGVTCAMMSKSNQCESAGVKCGSVGPLKLTYWGGRGLAEVSRTMLTIAGSVEWEDDRKSGMEDFGPENLGRLPLLSFNFKGEEVKMGPDCPI